MGFLLAAAAVLLALAGLLFIRREFSEERRVGVVALAGAAAIGLYLVLFAYPR